MQKFLVALGVMAYLFVVPISVGASGLVPACGGAGEPGCQACYVVELVNNVVTWLVMILGVIAAILIVVSGVRLVVSGGNVGAMEEAKRSMTNLIIGYLIVLSAWLALDYGLKVLLIGDGAFGVWNEVSCVAQPESKYNEVVQDKVVYIPIGAGLSNTPGWTYVPAGGSGGGGGDAGQAGDGGVYAAPCTRSPGPAGESTYSCTTQQAQCTAEGGIVTLNAARTVVTCNPRQIIVNGGTGGSLPQCTNSACSVAVLQAAGLSNKQANIMSCIAMTESTGNPNARSSGSTACGTFQVTRPTWSDFNPGGSCSNHQSSCTNASCNIRTMVNIVRSRQYGAWTCPGCNPKAILCIQRYGG